MKLGSVVFCLTFGCFWAGGSAQDLAALSNKLQQWNYTAHLSPSELEDSAIIEAMGVAQKVKAFWRPDNFKSIYTKESLGGKYGNISAECVNGYKHLLNGTDPDTGLPLILYMLDATGKPGAGYKEGNMYASGSYDECLAIGPGVRSTVLDTCMWVSIFRI